MTGPVLVRGNPTAEELAVVLAVLATRPAAPVAGVAPSPRSRWAVPVLRRPLVPGPGAWRASALPGPQEY